MSSAALIVYILYLIGFTATGLAVTMILKKLKEITICAAHEPLEPEQITHPTTVNDLEDEITCSINKIKLAAWQLEEFYDETEEEIAGLEEYIEECKKQILILQLSGLESE